MSAIEAIRARHRRSTEKDRYCDCLLCDQPWPCDASLLLAALSEAEADVKQADEDYARFYRHWKDRVTAAEARLEALEGHLAAVLGEDHDEAGLKERHPGLWADPKYAFFTASCDRRIAARAALAQEHTEPQEQT